jgi:UTP:GlnB (protein PII) uridylyltransferase
MNESRKQPGKKWREEILRWPTETAKEWTTRLLCSARSDNNVMAIVAVGSAVRPSVVSADLDLIVVRRELARSTLKPPMRSICVPMLLQRSMA